MKHIRCAVTTPEKLVYEGEAKMVVVPASDGELGIMPRHAPLMALLGTGELRLVLDQGERRSVFVDGGFVQVIDNTVNVLATEAELASEIDAQTAQADLDALLAQKDGGLDAEARAARREKVRAARIRVRLAGAKR